MVSPDVSGAAFRSVHASVVVDIFRAPIRTWRLNFSPTLSLTSRPVIYHYYLHRVPNTYTAFSPCGPHILSPDFICFV